MKSFKAEQVFESFSRGDRVATVSPLLQHDCENLYQIERAKMKRKMGRQKLVAFRALNCIFYPELHRGASQVLRFLKRAENGVQLEDDEFRQLIDSVHLLDHGINRITYSDRNPQSGLVEAMKLVNRICADNHVDFHCDETYPNMLVDYLNKRKYDGRFVAAYHLLENRGIDFEGNHEKFFNWTLVEDEHDDTLLTIGAKYNTRIKLEA